ncbi:CotH kinase family protein [Muriicola sp. Z0-33]|uniref:CotH kinase family protein n=1 Tax=Muriicola sp. Z0-33 TaxID=2816957 RepID=UPI00223789C6|nr:CotH kinase family protein [Muriicola sp. Z0-33]MCW5515907.1 hypothetical protein [Muriicola sp. Z0-33]
MKFDSILEIKKKVAAILLFFFFMGAIPFCNGQGVSKRNTPRETSGLFDSNEILPLRLRYSNQRIRLETNDSTYLKTAISYVGKDDIWSKMDVRMRARGKFRLDNCYFSPIKLRIDKADAEGTLFEGNKKLKLVLPCLNYRYMNDKLLREYLAYKMYEIVTPFHFKTRLVDIKFSEINGDEIIEHDLLGILVEDIKKVAKRHHGLVIDDHPNGLARDALTAVRNNFFQFMIGNTDYSNTYEHNQKLMIVSKNMIAVPYDFDMSGLVNPQYSVVADTIQLGLDISNSIERKYKGIEAPPELLDQVRQEFIAKKDRILEEVRRHRRLFRSRKEYGAAKEYLLGFYDILESDLRFQERIISVANE